MSKETLNEIQAAYKLWANDDINDEEFSIQMHKFLIKAYDQVQNEPINEPKFLGRTGKELVSMLEDVVTVLDLSGAMLERHGPLGTEPAELVRLVLDQKNMEIRALKHGMKDVRDLSEKPKP